MRILLPSHLALPAGGIRTYVRGLAPAMAAQLRDGEELVLASPAPASPGGRALARAGGPAGALARLAYEQLALPGRARGASSIHLCDLRAVLASTKPFVLTVHDVSFLDEPDWFAPGGARWKALQLRAALAKRPAAIVCDSEFTRGRLAAHHPQTRDMPVEVVAPGVELPPHPPRRAVAEDQPYLLTVGRIEPRKNHLGLLAAFRAARAEGLRLRWKVAGGFGPRHEPILRALRAEPGVDVLGAVRDPQLERLYAGASLFALASHQEGFGFPPLEALARGVPVLYASGSAMDESVADRGQALPPHDVRAWTAALLETPANPARPPALPQWGSAAGRILDIHRRFSDAGS